MDRPWQSSHTLHGYQLLFSGKRCTYCLSVVVSDSILAESFWKPWKWGPSFCQNPSILVIIDVLGSFSCVALLLSLNFFFDYLRLQSYRNLETIEYFELPFFMGTHFRGSDLSGVWVLSAWKIPQPQFPCGQFWKLDLLSFNLLYIVKRSCDFSSVLEIAWELNC